MLINTQIYIGVNKVKRVIERMKHNINHMQTTREPPV
ncbi:unnamed protein product [Arabidopsis halleri]